MQGKRVLVVGASSGIGRATGVLAAKAGARVALAARRREQLEEAAREAGAETVAIACDVRDETACVQAVAGAVEAFDGLDAVVFCAGTSPLGLLEEVDADGWRTVLETNVVGLASVARAALPHLAATTGTGRLVVLSSNSVERPFPGLVPYAASKAALDLFCQGWRTEHPDVACSRVVVGPTTTEFARDWDPDQAQELGARWYEEGYLGAAATVGPQQPEHVAEVILDVLQAPSRVTDVRVMPPATAE